MGVPTGAHLEGFCLDETQEPNTSPWDVIAHIHHIQESFVCVVVVVVVVVIVVYLYSASRSASNALIVP